MYTYYEIVISSSRNVNDVRSIEENNLPTIVQVIFILYKENGAFK